MSKGMAKAAELAAMFRSGTAVIWVQTTEDQRVDGLLFEAAASVKFETKFWDSVRGVTDLAGKVDPEYDGATADHVLDAIAKTGSRVVWVLHGLPPWLEKPIGLMTAQRLKNLTLTLKDKAREDAQSVVVVTPSSEVPAELAKSVPLIEWPLPDREEIAGLLDVALEILPAEYAPQGSDRDAVIDAAVGLSGEEAEATFALTAIQQGRIDPAAVAAEKQRAIRGSGLEWMEPLKGGLDGVGGLENWKSYASSRAAAYSPAAREYGLPAPKGVLLLGVPGCGKTLSAKGLAAEWKVPLIKLDLNALRGKYVGQSEASIRQAFSTIEALGRCSSWWTRLRRHWPVPAVTLATVVSHPTRWARCSPGCPTGHRRRSSWPPPTPSTTCRRN